MTQRRVILPTVSVSFEDTRQLFGLSASDAARTGRLVDLTFESSEMRATAKVKRRRKETATASVNQERGSSTPSARASG
jgi:hypothetical protein